MIELERRCFPAKIHQDPKCTMKTVAEESDFLLEEIAWQLLYLKGSLSVASSALPPPEHLKSPKVEPESPHSPPIRTVSPGIQLSGTEFKEKILKEQKCCKCKMSRCTANVLRLEHIATADGCSCSNGQNNIENETTRHAAAAYILEHNPKVFGAKIVTSPHKGEARCCLIVEKFDKGCHCKRSECLKGYCECYRANILCSESCKCFDCKNCEKSKERSSLEFKKRKSPVNLPD
ncbi:Protein tesmin/TSO1-like CXC 5 [Abeliophyllum distichum]|uniref:Protein tesmin/TSO1-like CXC 5 n=1 Tax=Abeliophyllum distichum TaxID=126358 RepID=A0ABD1V9U6_9LAMI